MMRQLYVALFTDSCAAAATLSYAVLAALCQDTQTAILRIQMC